MPQDLYGGYCLRLDDNDIIGLYEGQMHDPADHVVSLRRDLGTLGFALASEHLIPVLPTVFDRRLENAVREFQSYSKYETVAQDPHPAVAGGYALRLVKFQNSTPYAGPVSGVVNKETRDCIANWLNLNLRCPVVIYSKTPAHPDEENIWTAQQFRTGGQKLQFRDLSGVFAKLDPTAPEDGPAGVFIPPLIKRTADQGKKITSVNILSLGGPAITIRSGASNRATAVTPRLLAGVASKELKGLDASYFKVIRAVSELESSGRLDIINAYDAAVQSLGPFQQTIIASTASKLQTIGKGELPAFLSEVMSLSDPWFKDWLQMHGVRLPVWDEKGMHDAHLKKYTAAILRQTEAGQEPGNWQELAHEREVVEQFRHWHWTYRLAMLARTHHSCQTTFWTACKRRIDDILSTPWGNLPDGSTWAKTTCIGDVFRSEMSVAMLLRVHVNAPGYVCSTNAGPFVQLAFTESKVSANTALAALQEDKLVDGLLSAIAIPSTKKVRKGAPWLTDDLYYLYNWKGWSDNGDSQDDLKLDCVFSRK